MTASDHHGQHDHGQSHKPGEPCGCGHLHICPADPDALVSARGVSVARGGRTLLASVDFDVRPGEIVTVIGPNGAGKTTLVKLVTGILRPDKGTLLKSPHLQIGYVPQRFEADRTIPMTVRRFLSLGNFVKDADVSAALEEVGALRIAAQQLSELSGGETQRVLIARALLRKPNLLVLDEPASGVDYAGEADLYELVSNLRDRRKLGVLLVSHDLHVVMAKSDHVICLNGHVCCSGRPQAVAKDAEYVRLFGAEIAKSLAVYHHHHDHTHDISGAPVPAGERETGSRGT